MNVQRTRKENNLGIIILCFACICLYPACKSTDLHGNGISTTEIRDGISELENGEYKSLKLENEFRENQRELQNETDRIGEIIDKSTEHYRTIDRILQQIREQPLSE